MYTLMNGGLYVCICTHAEKTYMSSLSSDLEEAPWAPGGLERVLRKWLYLVTTEGVSG